MFFTHNMYEESDSFDPLSIVEPDELSPPAMEVHNFNPHGSSSHHQVVSFNSSLPDSSYTTSPDLLALYHMSNPSPAGSFLPIPSGAFGNTAHLSFSGDIPVADAASASSVVCDPLLYLNLPPQPPPFRELFQSLPATGYALFGDEQIEAAGGGMYAEEQVGEGVMDFGLKMGKRRKGGKGTKQFVNDRERRVQVKDTYEVLRNLVPKPSKDRASIVADAIKYIKELIASVNDLKMLVEKKRCAKARNKRLKAEEDSTENGIESSCVTKPGLIADTDQASFNNGSSLRSSWVHRKSKDTEVDVRIIDDEVTIKLVQRKRMNRNLLYVSKILDELQLDLHHVAGGHVGDYYSYLFNTKINEGSCVYASGIANRIMDMVEGPNASTPTTSCS